MTNSWQDPKAAISNASRWSLGSAMATLLCSMVVLNSGCQIPFQPPVVGSGNIVTEERDIESFDRLVLSGAGDVEVRTGLDPRVLVSIDDNLQPHIHAATENGRLLIKSTRNYSTKNSLQVEVATKSLNEIDVTGSGDVNVDNLIVEKLDVEVTGSGSVKINGIAGVLKITITGSGDVDLRELEAESVIVNITGSGSAKVHALSDLKANITGSGSVRYVPVPGLEEVANVTGSGSARPLD